MYLMSVLVPKEKGWRIATPINSLLTKVKTTGLIGVVTRLPFSTLYKVNV